MGNCWPGTRRPVIKNEALKVKLLDDDAIQQINDKIRALETKMEMRTYEVDLAIKYLGDQLH